MPGATRSPLAKKLNIKDGMKVRVLGKPADADLTGITATSSSKADAILVFVKDLADVEAKAGPVVEAGKEDRIAWLAYPKAGQLDTDLNRDILWRHMLEKGVEAVRQIAIDDVWSALRFRPKK